MTAKETGLFGRGKFTDEEEEAIEKALHNRLGANYISQVSCNPMFNLH